MKYRLNNNVRIIQQGNIIIFRKGLWDYTEASLDLNEHEEELAKKICNLVTTLWQNKEIDSATEEDQKILELIDGLSYSDIIVRTEEAYRNEEILKILLGNMAYQAKLTEGNNKIVLVTDSKYVAKIAKSMSEEIGLELDIMTDELKVDISRANLNERLDALYRIDKLEEIYEKLEDYKAIVYCGYRIDTLFLRNINELCVEKKIQLLFSALDGPFIHFAGFNPPKSADFDSLEQRILSRLNDHVLYHAFSNSEVHQSVEDYKPQIPILTMMLSLLMSEAYLVCKVGACKLEGRLLSIYLPTLEIQVQDILKIATSTTMGAMAKAIYEDNQIATRKLLDEITEEYR